MLNKEAVASAGAVGVPANHQRYEFKVLCFLLLCKVIEQMISYACIHLAVVVAVM